MIRCFKKQIVLYERANERAEGTKMSDRDAVYIRDPRTKSEYAQNVRNFRDATAGPKERLEEILREPGFPTEQQLRADWAALNEDIATKEAARDNIIRVMPLMGKQMDAEIKTMRRQQLYLEVAVNTMELLKQNVRFARTYHAGDDEDVRACVDCGTRKNITHQAKDDASKVYCKDHCC